MGCRSRPPSSSTQAHRVAGAIFHSDRRPVSEPNSNTSPSTTMSISATASRSRCRWRPSPDILLGGRTTSRFVWYRNPAPAKGRRSDGVKDVSWPKTSRRRTTSCIAARDIDGDGKSRSRSRGVDPGYPENSGAVLLPHIPPADRTQLWTPVKRQHEPTVHGHEIGSRTATANGVSSCPRCTPRQREGRAAGV